MYTRLSHDPEASGGKVPKHGPSVDSEGPYNWAPGPLSGSQQAVLLAQESGKKHSCLGLKSHQLLFLTSVIWNWKSVTGGKLENSQIVKIKQPSSK